MKYDSHILTCTIFLIQVIIKATDDYTKSRRIDWVRAHTGQAVLCVSQLYWTEYVTTAIKTSAEALNEYYELNNRQIDDIVELVRGKLNMQNRVTLGALVVLDVHARDVLKELCEKGSSSTAFSCPFFTFP